jgi:mono/diheme cytochrome c family protein
MAVKRVVSKYSRVMKSYIFFVITALMILVGYSNCGQVGETGLTTANSVQDADPVQGSLVYNVDGFSQPACVTCHGATGDGVVGVDLKAFSDEDIETALRTGPGVMPIYNDTDVSYVQLKNLIAYIRTL